MIDKYNYLPADVIKEIQDKMTPLPPESERFATLEYEDVLRIARLAYMRGMEVEK